VGQFALRSFQQLVQPFLGVGFDGADRDALAAQSRFRQRDQQALHRGETGREIGEALVHGLGAGEVEVGERLSAESISNPAGGDGLPGNPLSFRRVDSKRSRASADSNVSAKKLADLGRQSHTAEYIPAGVCISNIRRCRRHARPPIRLPPKTLDFGSSGRWRTTLPFPRAAAASFWFLGSAV